MDDFAPEGEAINKDGVALWNYLAGRARLKTPAECERLRAQMKKIKVMASDAPEEVESSGAASRVMAREEGVPFTSSQRTKRPVEGHLIRKK